MGVEEAEAELWAASLKAFVTRRKALAKALRAAGDKEGARTVTAMAKPSMPAWVVNQLVRRHRTAVDAALAAFDAQRDLQLGALSGGLDAKALAAAKGAEREAMQAVTALAKELLEEDGHAASRSNVERVGKTLRAAALDPEARPLLEAGTLVSDVSQGGFEAVASQLDPAMLLAALSAGASQPKRKRKKVDGMFARSARSDAGRDDTVVVESAQPVPEPSSSPPKPNKRDAERRAREAEQRDRLATAKVTAAKTRTQIAEQRVVVASGEERVVTLEGELQTARAEVRAARRKLGDLKQRLEQAEKRIRVLES